LLANPGMELGPVDWRIASPWGPDKVIYRGGEADAHAGQWVALLGGFATPSVESMSQQVTIPDNARVANLDLYLWVYAPNSGPLVSDTLEVRVEDTGESFKDTVAVYTNLDKTGWYVLKTVDLLPYRGRTVILTLQSSSNQTASTSFFIDDVTLDVIQ
jgi:aminopeptidase S